MNAWQGAACWGHDPALWFPKRFVPNKNPTAEAVAICRRCPVRQACLDHALSFDPPVIGIWGGQWLGSGEIGRNAHSANLLTKDQLKVKASFLARQGLNAAAIARTLLVPRPRVEKALRPDDTA